MGKNHQDRDLVLVQPALDILQYYHIVDSKGNDYVFPLISNDAPYAKFVTLGDRDRMKHLKKIAALAEIETPLSMHMSRHAFAHIAQEAGKESGAIKDLLGHSNLLTTERYMGNFDTTKQMIHLEIFLCQRNLKQPQLIQKFPRKKF